MLAYKVKGRAGATPWGLKMSDSSTNTTSEKTSSPLQSVALAGALVMGPVAGGLGYTANDTALSATTERIGAVERDVSECVQRLAVYDVRLVTLVEQLDRHRQDLNNLGQFSPRAALDPASLKRKKK